ncbi:hypothetical protein ZIOFF_031863 [Zingiber officinale]|uniref:OVATE domain-containing protein n=1 Tax=Zingiber officinale TaxID=94328 RepID=A0A8J5L0N6_ZINOF|nr:hypothetical protein ZIOFF_031863 [Zingiber officinale]
MIDMVSWRRISWLFRLSPHRRHSADDCPEVRFRSVSKLGDRWSCFNRSSFRLTFCTSRPSEELDKLGELPSLAERERLRAPFPSPITPAYVKLARLRSSASSVSNEGEISMLLQEEEEEEEAADEEAEAACWRFERCVAEMLAAEEKVSDLVEVEELLSYLRDLTSPAFVELVGSFYEQICRDLFIRSDDDDAMLRA